MAWLMDSLTGKNTDLRKDKAMKKLIIPALLTLLLAGCSISFIGNRVDFDTVEKQIYENEAGYSVMLPADWALAAETEESSSFVSADQAVALNISNELGGMEYYSLTEIGDMLTKQLMDQVFSSAEAKKAAITGSSYYRSISGVDQAGEEISAELYISEPFVAVRYYLLFLIDADQSRAMSDVVDGVIDSFTICGNKDQVYELMRERAEAREEAEKAAEQEENSN